MAYFELLIFQGLLVGDLGWKANSVFVIRFELLSSRRVAEDESFGTGALGVLYHVLVVVLDYFAKVVMTLALIQPSEYFHILLFGFTYF